MDPQLEQIFAELQAKNQGRAQSMAEIFHDALSQVDTLTPPAAQPVPQVANPFGQMASVFASTLAEQLGARGSMAANQATLAQQREDKQRVEQANFARSEAFNHEKQMQRFGVLLKIGDMKAKALEDQGDLDKYEAQVKANSALADKARKAQEAFDLKKIGIEHQNKLEEIAAAKKPTKAETDALAQDKEDKLILKFQEDISNVARKPGNTAKTPAHRGGALEWIGLDKSTPETIDLTESGVQAILSRSAAAAKSAGGVRLQHAALETFFETAKNAGLLAPGKKEYLELGRILTAVFKDNPKGAQEWIDAHK
jgi:hypothetical protein